LRRRRLLLLLLLLLLMMMLLLMMLLMLLMLPLLVRVSPTLSTRSTLGAPGRRCLTCLLLAWPTTPSLPSSSRFCLGSSPSTRGYLRLWVIWR